MECEVALRFGKGQLTTIFPSHAPPRLRATLAAQSVVTRSAPWEEYAVGDAAPSNVLLRIRRRLLSPELRNYRDLIVALPPSYHDSDERYPVVYMQDGQNLFDPTTSYAGDWRLLPSLNSLADQGTEAIIVAVPNVGKKRLYEYSPFVDRRMGGGGADRYLTFLSETVKPLIDGSFRTREDPENTAIMGSSMGGLVSLYAVFRRPEIFGRAGVMSPSLWFAGRAMLRYVAQAGAASTRRVYLDIGLKEPRGAVADARLLRNILIEQGLDSGDLDYVEDEQGTHSEEAWGRRFEQALTFLIGSGK
jgi:predicted alpha/beta superfamily hydrolase